MKYIRRFVIESQLLTSDWIIINFSRLGNDHQYMIRTIRSRIWSITLFENNRSRTSSKKLFITCSPLFTINYKLIGSFVLSISRDDGCHGSFPSSNCTGGSGFLPRMRSDMRSATIITGALRFPFVIDGNIDASATRKLFTPKTRPLLSTTAPSSGLLPILAVPHGW